MSFPANKWGIATTNTTGGVEGINFVGKEATTMIADEKGMNAPREETSGRTGDENSRGTAEGAQITESLIVEGEIAPADR